MKALSLASALITLLFAPALAGAQQAATEPRPIALDEAVRLARLNSPATVQSRNAMRTGRASVVYALSQFLPRLDVSARAGRADGSIFFQGHLEPYTGDPWSYSKGYSASVLLFDAGQRWFGYQSARANERANAESDLLQRFNVALSVKQQYFAVLAARESEAAAARQLEQAQEQLKASVARMRVGAVARVDSIRSAIAVGNARIAILTARNNLESANASLTRLVGSADDVTALASDTSEAARIEVDSAALAGLAANSPAVRQGIGALEASRALRRTALTPYLPSVFVGYSYGTNRTSSRFDWGGGPAPESRSLGFFVSYSLFNNFSRELQLTTASVNADNAEANLRDAKLAARQNLKQYLAAWRTAAQTIELQQLQVAAAEEDVKAQQQRYNLGAAALLDVLSSQTVLDNARVALINARFQARTAKAQLEALVGRELR